MVVHVGHIHEGVRNDLVAFWTKTIRQVACPGSHFSIIRVVGQCICEPPRNGNSGRVRKHGWLVASNVSRRLGWQHANLFNGVVLFHRSNLGSVLEDCTQRFQDGDTLIDNVLVNL